MKNDEEKNKLIRVYFDGHCGVCRNEMTHYQHVAPKGVFEWLDVTQAPGPVLPSGVSALAALSVLHVQDASGVVYKGLDAFLIIWQQLPRFHWLYRFLRYPVIYSIACYSYSLFAGIRFRWMGYHRCVLQRKPLC